MPEVLVGPGRLELPTLRLSGVRSNHLSYGPMAATAGCETQARDRVTVDHNPYGCVDDDESGKRNGDGGVPPFIGASIDSLVRDGLEKHP